MHVRLRAAFRWARGAVRRRPVRDRDVMWLAASPAQVAVQLRSFDSPSAPGVCTPPAPTASSRSWRMDVGEEPFDPLWPPLSVTDAGRVHAGGDADAALAERERRPRSCSRPRATRGSWRPPAASAWRRPTGALIVFDLRSGTELHQISLGSFDAQVTSLAISPAGDVAATTATGDGSDVVLWAPAGAKQVRVLATLARAEEVATAGGRVAFVGSNRLDGGGRCASRSSTARPGRGSSAARSRPRPVRPQLRRRPHRLPDGGVHAGLGRHRCLVELRGARGACARTAATVASLARAGAYARVKVACLSAPATPAAFATRLGSARATARIPAGRTGTLRLRARGAKISVRVTDPDGRSRPVSGD